MTTAKERRNLASRRVVESLMPREMDYRVWDEKLPGFGLRVAPNGTRKWFIQFRSVSSPWSRRMYLGDVREVGPDSARLLARGHLGDVAKGGDPLEARRAKRAQGKDSARHRQGSTVAAMAESYLETLRLMKSAKWTREARRLYEVHLEAAVGARLAADIDVRDVRRLHERLASTPVQANRVKAVLSGILSRAEVDGARPKGSGNPCSGVDDYVETKRERILSDDEWKRFAKALKAESLALRDVPEWDTRPAQLRAVMLIALTGARKEAVTRRVWSDLDEAAGILKVEPAHKGATRIYLGPPALKLLTAWQRERSKSPYIFPGQQRRVGPRLNRRTSKQRPLRSATPIASLAPVWNSLRERAELEDFTLHDLRHQLGTVGGDVGLSAHLIGGLLSHRVPGITGTYAHRSDPTLREAAARVSAEIAKRLQLDTAVRAGRWLALAK